MENGADHRAKGYKALCNSILFSGGVVVDYLFELMVNDVGVDNGLTNGIFDKVYNYALMGANKVIIKKLHLLGYKCGIPPDIVKQDNWSWKIMPSVIAYVQNLNSPDEILAN